jgi:hypothetical protein
MDIPTTPQKKTVAFIICKNEMQIVESGDKHTRFMVRYYEN